MLVHTRLPTRNPPRPYITFHAQETTTAEIYSSIHPNTIEKAPATNDGTSTSEQHWCFKFNSTITHERKSTSLISIILQNKSWTRFWLDFAIQITLLTKGTGRTNTLQWKALLKWPPSGANRILHVYRLCCKRLTWNAFTSTLYI
jgi:hypothetical protein